MGRSHAYALALLGELFVARGLEDAEVEAKCRELISCRCGSQADGHADAWRRSAAPAHAVEVLLTPGSSLSGRVVDARTGRAVAGARVSSVLALKDPDPSVA